jgi:uncharacterized protein (TIGR03435 family)
MDPGRLTARRASLKGLICEAYHLQYYQVSGGPAWIGDEEWDIDAKAERSSSPDELRLMLRALLADRFKLAVHTTTKEMKVYALVLEKEGRKPKETKEDSVAEPPQKPGVRHFHGSLNELAGVLSIQLTMAMPTDPTVPSRATGAPTPVLNQTNLDGVYDIDFDLADAGADTFAAWQRALHDQLGLKLEARRAPVEILVVDHAER